MATLSEIKSLEDINYKSKIKTYWYFIIIPLISIIAFLNYYPISMEVKNFMKKNLKGSACSPDYDELRIEWLLPKLIISDLTLPSSCFGKSGEPLKFSFVSLNFHFISFSPLGIPFKLQTEVNGQPLTVYFVQGIGKRLIRVKDQSIVLSRLQGIAGGNFKLSGNIKLDFSGVFSNSHSLMELAFKAQTKDLQIPPQNIEGFTTPSMKVNDLYVEANATNSSKINVKKIILGDPESPMRASFKGTIDYQKNNFASSPINLTGEIAFAQNFKETVPLVDLFFQNYLQKDGFYQIRLGGMLGQPKLMNL
jgi:hypothetical protein